MWDSLRKTLWWEPVSDQLLSKMWMYCLFRKCFSCLIFSWLENSEIYPYALLNCLNPQSFEAYFPWVLHLKEYKLHYIHVLNYSLASLFPRCKEQRVIIVGERFVIYLGSLLGTDHVTYWLLHPEYPVLGNQNSQLLLSVCVIDYSGMLV